MKKENDFVHLEYGAGAQKTREFIDKIFLSKFKKCESREDAATIYDKALAYTTDSYVIEPEIFPGGDIGKLSICGTANDLAVRGAIPKWLSVGFILSEGYPLDKLAQIVNSMAKTADDNNIAIVTGDTKVIDKNAFSGIIINTSGVGIIKNIMSIDRIRDGDALIVSGTLGDHSASIICEREGLYFDSTIKSDCAVLYPMLLRLIEDNKCGFIRDMTRGGLASIVYEINEATNYGLEINSSSIPISKEVKKFCEVTGFDPLSLANEGKVLISVPKAYEEKVLSDLRLHPLGQNASIIGYVTSKHNKVILRDKEGDQELMKEGQGIPRIC